MSLTSLGPTSTLLGGRRSCTAATPSASAQPSSSAGPSFKPSTFSAPAKAAAPAPAKKLGGGLGGGLGGSGGGSSPPEPAKKPAGPGAKKPVTAVAAYAAAKPRATGSCGLRSALTLTHDDDDDDDVDAISIDDGDDDLSVDESFEVPELPPPKPTAVSAKPASREPPSVAPAAGGARLQPRAAQPRPQGAAGAAANEYDDSFEEAADESQGEALGWGQSPKRGCTQSNSSPTLHQRGGANNAGGGAQPGARAAAGSALNPRQALPSSLPARSQAAAKGGGFEIPACPFGASAATAPQQQQQQQAAMLMGAAAGAPTISASYAAAAAAASAQLSAVELENTALKARIDSLLHEQTRTRERLAAEHSAEAARAAAAHETELRRVELARGKERDDGALKLLGAQRELEAAKADAAAQLRKLQAELDATRREREQAVGRAHDEQKHVEDKALAELAREREAAAAREAEVRVARDELSRLRASHAEEIRRLRAVHSEAAAAAAALAARESESLSEQKAHLSTVLTVADEVKGAVAAMQLLQRRVEAGVGGGGAGSAAEMQAEAAKRAALELAEARLDQQHRQLEVERRELGALVASMREQVKVAADSTADDKRRLESEHATLQRAADNWERERREAAAALRHERVALDAMREQREKERAEHLAWMDAQHEALASEQARVADAREQLGHDKAAVVVRAADAEGKLEAFRRELALQQAALAETKRQLVDEKEKVLEHRRDLDDERQRFGAQAEALTELGLQVQRESRDVARAHESSRAQLDAARDAEARAEQARADAAAERLAIEDGAHALATRRRGFEEERLAAARERKALVTDRLAVGRTAEATRSLQLQLVEQLRDAATDDDDDDDGGGGGGGGGGGEAARDAAARAGVARARARAQSGAARRAPPPRRAWAASGGAPGGAVATAGVRSVEKALLAEERARASSELSAQSHFIAQLRARPALHVANGQHLYAAAGAPPPFGGSSGGGDGARYGCGYGYAAPSPAATHYAPPPPPSTHAHGGAQREPGADGLGPAWETGGNGAGSGRPSTRADSYGSSFNYAFPSMVQLGATPSGLAPTPAGGGPRALDGSAAPVSSEHTSSLRGSSLLSSWNLGLGDTPAPPAGSGRDVIEALP